MFNLLMSLALSLSFYTIFFSLLPLTLAVLYLLLDNDETRAVPFSPNLYTTAWHVLRNDLRDLRKWRTCKLAFPPLGWRCWGWVYNNQYQNEYQMAEPYGYCTCLIMMQHVSFSPNFYTTALTVLHVMFPVTFKSEGLAKCPARLQVELYNGNWKMINKHCISWTSLHFCLEIY
jgi:hypothetical protein